MNKESLSLIEHKENVWFDKELLKGTDIYDLDSLMSNLSKFKISFVGMGYYGIVFRLQKPQSNFDITLKLMRFNTSINAQNLTYLFRESHVPQNNALVKLFLLTDFRNRPDYLTRNLAFAQSAGHVLGNIIAPEYIDTPIALWTRDSDLVGYSLPYLEGISERISKDKELNILADELEKKYNLILQGF